MLTIRVLRGLLLMAQLWLADPILLASPTTPDRWYTATSSRHAAPTRGGTIPAHIIPTPTSLHGNATAVPNPTPWNGHRCWLHGVNYPWLNLGNDFGNT